MHAKCASFAHDVHMLAVRMSVSIHCVSLPCTYDCVQVCEEVGLCAAYGRNHQVRISFLEYNITK